ncbi:hypothetical protein NCAS_0C04300 [Naumovozyma castellii]|uniref:Spt20-like SEP domain-containing protein n=1 Tax=Naumovozyma castellii TaxID=27288 RepID=G0VD58_NAUCA|nr:hypothetical protein NCAS_0C04300 [Naumovozyma castellii CBS 4309]CCC69420.1 hypothetical protein NCAS_0C04300 [Naumovozyma castellii CBS 4309]
MNTSPEMSSDGHPFGIPVNSPSMKGSPPSTAGGGPVNVGSNAVRTTTLTPQQQQQQQLLQKQRMLLQQQQQQQRHQQSMQNFEAQFYQLLMTINKKPKRLYNFVEDSDAILKKYEQYRPSFEFHIYENNYKICAPANTRLQQQQKNPEISSDGLVLNKNNETLKEFLEYVARGKIPEAIMEVLKDCNIQFYEGNLILQVYDHTNTVDVTTAKDVKVENNQSPPARSMSPSNARATSPAAPATFKRPRVYRTLLRPNDLTTYYDMMAYADHAKFSDTIYQQFESEILTLTKRNLKLDVPLNPYEHRDKLEDELFAMPQWDNGELKHHHREECTVEGSKGQVKHVEEHGELPQHSSNYEQLMLIMNDRTITTTNSTFAITLAKNATKLLNNANGNNSSSSNNTSSNSKGNQGGTVKNSSNGNSSSGTQVAIAAAAAAAAAAAGATVGNENNQFSRLKFIEQWRVNKEKRKQQQFMTNNNSNTNSAHMNVNNVRTGSATPFSSKISMGAPLSAQQQFLQQQQALEQQQQQQQGKGTKRNGGGSNGGTPKPKKPRKTKKKAEGETAGAKKKRAPAKKQSGKSTPSA